MMTQSQAAALRMRWKERADLFSTDCEHHARTKEAIMTNAQAVNFQAESKGQGDSPPLCEHPIQELARLARSDKDYRKGYLMGTYHCCECGEAIVYIRKPPSFSNISPICHAPVVP
jgi:hypothetical protein